MINIKEIFQGLVVSIIFILFVLVNIIMLNYQKIVSKNQNDKLPSMAIENGFKMRYNKSKCFRRKAMNYKRFENKIVVRIDKDVSLNLGNNNGGFY